ncbi:hypothetical protein SFBSU_006G394 [Candidatus Arthromitus sp. SFB-mouse-SU]|nr:hypothetical protein SFBNYU_009160 [Candidatus Arthromitus sp. SFB-mouse-NYU]EIA21906.1 hypothetical protein SFB2_292G9 [Candidatus Arthromitus sp. SFB-2]EIA23374.1 hypothetical protein SFB1_177G1 [Candidatus Arthromitus sp. SFB-1]EIA26784.1 hypothetical protein SFB3_001G13 [Candidatus Arthromitus sp. SFB-3]EIA28302.1 hypothetical protein SFB4_128G3 [Candidatus Arthromitus sp. SFB-4]EIA28622.1 hypothetical protein SFB6_038G34 [Candidatus Arthromitus sp. SFB-co]EIA30713.1 hypothetical prote
MKKGEINIITKLDDQDYKDIINESLKETL